jgi:hypothetical protein
MVRPKRIIPTKCTYSLIQNASGETLGQELFYQLTLLQFGGLRVATLKEWVDVMKVMSFAMKLKEGNDDDHEDCDNDSDAN